MFQSSPSLVTGRYDLLDNGRQLIEGKFQSSPSLVTGRYIPRIRVAPYAEGVSILAQSGDWALLPTPMRLVLAASKFQSSPSLVTGRYRHYNDIQNVVFCFNPRPVW